MRAPAVVAGAAAAASLALAAEAGELPPPPYLARGAHNLIVGFEVDADALRAALPPEFRPASSVVALNMYVVPRGLGVAPYTRSYVWADVEGHDSWDGTKGRYVLAGWGEPEGFRGIATGGLRWPAEPGTTAVERAGDAVRATLSVGGEPWIAAEARLAEKPPAEAASLLPYPFLAADAPGGVGVNLIPWAGTVREAVPVAVELRVPDGHPLARLRPKRLAWAIEVRDASFALGFVAVPAAR